MDVGKILSADWSSKTAQKVIRRGNQFVRSKTIVTPMGRTTLKLKGDEVILEDSRLLNTRDFSSSSEISPKAVAKFLFDHFEYLFDKKSDAWPDIVRAFS